MWYTVHSGYFISPYSITHECNYIYSQTPDNGDSSIWKLADSEHDMVIGAKWNGFTISAAPDLMGFSP